MNLANLAVAASSLFLVPFGPIDKLVQKHNPWRGFEAHGPVVWVVRVEDMKSESCDKWIRAVTTNAPGLPLGSDKNGISGEQIRIIWEPWEKAEREQIETCEKLPCGIKLNQSEVSIMASVSHEKRTDEFLALVKKRSKEYKQTQRKKEYEFPGDPVDPWVQLKNHGFQSEIPNTSSSIFWARKLNFASGKIQSLHQILDRRVEVSPSEREASVWTRDAYTDHYFDSWGEGEQVTCEFAHSRGRVTLIQSLVLELDLLKRNDPVSQLMRGRIKSAVEENGHRYLDRAFSRLESRLK